MLEFFKNLKFIFAISMILGIFGCGNNGSPTPNTTLSGTILKSVELAWDSPTTNTNGSTLSNLAGYKIYMGPTPGKLTLLSDVGISNNYTVTGLAPGSTFYFGITSYDSYGSESDMSNLITG